MLISGISTLYCSAMFWMRYIYNPTVLELDLNYRNWNITFPSMTLCNHNKLNETALQHYLNEYHNATTTELINLEQFLRKLVELNYDNMDIIQFNGVEPDQYLKVIIHI